MISQEAMKQDEYDEIRMDSKKPKRKYEYNTKMTVSDFQEANEELFIEDFMEDYTGPNPDCTPDSFYDKYLPEQEDYHIELMQELYTDVLQNNL